MIKKTEIIEILSDIIIESGTIIPGLYSDDLPIQYEVFIPKGSKLDMDQCVVVYNDGNKFLISPEHPAILYFIYAKAIEQECCNVLEQEIQRRIVYKMFALITENRVKPKIGNYITEFKVETFEQADILAEKFAKEKNIEVYTILKA